MAVSLILLKIDGADGDVTIFGKEKCIAVDSFSWSLENKLQSADPQGTTGTSGKVYRFEAKSLNIKKQFDSASTKLHNMMKTQPDKRFGATLYFIDPASRGSHSSSGTTDIGSVLQIKLEGCRIDRISLSATDSGKAISLSESLSISYDKQATLTYQTSNPVTKMRGNPSDAELPAFYPSKT